MFAFVRHFVCVFLFSVVLLQAEEVLDPSITIQIPMRDGTTLATDLYYPPEGLPSDYPCVLLRSPAGRKNSFATSYITLCHFGYVVAIQDTRSAQDLEGKTLPWASDGWGDQQDGYDTIEWLASSVHCNGKIGTAGVSALGISQLMLAPTAPPSLVCQHIGVAASSLYHHGFCPGGQVLKHQVEGWLGYYAKDSGVHGFLSTRPFYNDFWKNFNTLSVADQVKVPALHFGGWYDTFLQGTIDSFVAFQEKGGEGARGKQHLVIGPWSHFWPHVKTLGDFPVPKGGFTPPIDYTPLAWFDYHLKGKNDAFGKTPSVVYYVMGPFDGSPSKGNVWKFADRWPVSAKETSFYLTDANALVLNNKDIAESAYTYTFDPANPTPTIGGRNLFLESGAKDQSPIEKRDDVVVFTTTPLTKDLEVTGQIKAKIFFSSDCVDTDVVVRLTDLYPDGRSILIADGIYRVGAHVADEKGKDINKPHEVEVDLWATSIVFAKDHRIRVSVTSSNYPRYEVNQNVGYTGMHSGIGVIATNSVHVGKAYPSRLILPVVD